MSGPVSEDYLYPSIIVSNCAFDTTAYSVHTGVSAVSSDGDMNNINHTGSRPTVLFTVY